MVSPVPPLKVAFLVGRDDDATAYSLCQLCQTPGIQVAGVLIDTGRSSGQQRWRNFRRNLRREGLAYLPYRLSHFLLQHLEHAASRVIPRQEVNDLLRRAFPERNLTELARMYQFPVIEAGNLNEAAACEKLRALAPDLAVALGTRILRPQLFRIPRLGCLNLHKGSVPEYRGTPPAFWELYEKQTEAGVTIHFIDEGLDTGDIVTAGTIPIHPKETPESLSAKLTITGTGLLAQALQQIHAGTAQPKRQPAGTRPPRTRPTLRQREELARRLPHWRRPNAWWQIVKLIAWLAIFHSGLFRLVRGLHQRNAGGRGAILLYHRVNDMSVDVLTTSTRRFAEHLVTLRHYYRTASTAELVDAVAGQRPIPPTSVAVHFDDCYRDVRTDAARLLNASGIPGTAFISSGFIGTGRVFDHDAKKYPHRFDNLSSSEVCELPTLGVDVAAHTVNHVDLGSIPLEQARIEVYESRQELEQILQKPVELFSFPFGGLHNIREEVRDMVRKAGYKALFSAHGGFVQPGTDVFDIPRFGVSSDHSPLALLMEMEGLSIAHLRHLWKKRRHQRA